MPAVPAHLDLTFWSGKGFFVHFYQLFIPLHSCPEVKGRQRRPESAAGTGCTPVWAQPGASNARLPGQKHIWDAQGSSTSRYRHLACRAATTHAIKPQKLPAQPGEAVAQAAAHPCVIQLGPSFRILSKILPLLLSYLGSKY